MGSDLLLTLLLVALNGFFVAAEFAIVKVRSSEIEIIAKQGGRVAKQAKHILANLDKYIAATQLGITLASLALGWFGEHAFFNLVKTVIEFFGVVVSDGPIHSIAFAIAFFAITMLHIIFGELAPKSLALQRTVNTVMAISIPLHLFSIVFSPFIWLLNGLANVMLKIMGMKDSKDHNVYHSSEELQYLLDQGKETGALDSAEHELIQNVFDFNERVVKNIMVPRTKVSGVEQTCGKQELLDILMREGYSRLPIYDQNIDKIIGIVHAKDVLPRLIKGEEWELKDIIRTPYFVPENKKINDLMSDMREKRIQMANVLDEFGGTAGIVTLEDIVEEIVGEIQDEYDEEKPIVEQLTDKEFIVNASATVYDVNEYLPHDLPEKEDYDTISGMVSNVFEKIPNVGEQIEFQGYLITVLKKSSQKIETVKMELLLEEEDQVNVH